MNLWYQGLTRPPLTPPNWVFSPVWTVLYLSIALAVFLYYRSLREKRVHSTTVVLIAHLAANFSWTYLFFGLHSPLAALIDILFLDLSLIILINRMSKVRRVCGLILIPYLIWILFATYLNLGFYILN